MESTRISDSKSKPHPFSIVAILGEDFFKEEKQSVKDFEDNKDGRHEVDQPARPIIRERGTFQENASYNIPMRFEWLDCTRYNPPKVPRSKRKPGMQARASRHPRVPFTPFQQATFEERFQSGHYLTASTINELSASLDVPDYRIKIWFQNRRARERRDVQQRMTHAKTSNENIG